MELRSLNGGLLMSKRFAVVLAAGQGTRMKSNLYKVLHKVCGKPMVRHVVDQLSTLNLDELVVVIGHGADKVKEEFKGYNIQYTLQAEQLGTAHAVQQASDILKNKDGVTLVVCGDTPLITSQTLDNLLYHHEQTEAKVSVLTAKADDPTGYGRVIRNASGLVERIVEHKDASTEEKEVNEINTGIFCFDNLSLFEALQHVQNNNVQGEYYLPDVLGIIKKQGDNVAAYQTESFDESIGINDRVALSKAEKLMRNRINQMHMKNGVTIIDPDNTYISAESIIGQDTILYPGTMLLGETVLGESCIVGPHTEVKESTIQNNTVIRQSVVHNSTIGNSVNIGPFAHIRPQSELCNDVKIGNFVEVKKSRIDNGSKASHLSYIGDAEVGENVNLGCGSITVNYDGENKHLTKIEDGVFVGCNSNLIAPVHIKKYSYIAAGSTVTNDVPENTLAIARARQVNKENYVEKLKNKGKNN
jgi:bifunctional UDP-N-acetylglucosamine pyrophosphorylase/glucosamine-1-phosphate N-acetyltransferase